MRAPRSPENIVDSFEWNKIAGATLGASLVVLALVIGTGEAFHHEKLAKPGYIVAGVEEVASAAGPAPVADKPIEFYLASASVEKGADVFKKCGACHNAEKGGANGIGPNLYGVVGGPHAHIPGFAYSSGMAALAAKPWGWTEMNAWLTSPKAYVAGTKMAFAGLSKPEERAAVIAYLNSKSDKPLPLPAVPAEAAPAAAAPADAAPATTATADKPAPQPGKAPDVAPGSTKAVEAQGTSKTDPA